MGQFGRSLYATAGHEHDELEGSPFWVGASIMSRVRVASASTAKGVVIISIPGSRKPFAIVVFSADPVMTPASKRCYAKLVAVHRRSHAPEGTDRQRRPPEEGSIVDLDVDLEDYH